MGSLLDRVRTRLFGEPDLQQTDVTDELRGAGTAFATLAEGVGKAVALTTQELDQTAGHIATEMARLKVNTVQAVVSSYGDTGNLEGVSVITGETSALSIAVPPALAFENVHIEGSFAARELSVTSSANVNVNLVSGSFGSRGLGLRGPNTGASVTNTNTNLQTAQTEDSSVASMSMTARIRPKPVRELAKPPLVFKGPSLTLTVQAYPAAQVVNPAPAQPADPPYLERRRAIIRVALQKNGGGVVQNPRPIAIDCGVLDWEVTDASGASVTTGPVPDSSSGEFFITATRTVTSSGEGKKDFVIRAVLNLVNAVLHISL